MRHIGCDRPPTQARVGVSIAPADQKQTIASAAEHSSGGGSGGLPASPKRLARWRTTGTRSDCPRGIPRRSVPGAIARA
jgi:hypothetical protein